MSMNSTFAEKDPTTISVRDKYQSGGTYAWYDIFHFGKVTFQNVWTETSIEVTYEGDEEVIVQKRSLHCEGEGLNPCSWSGTQGGFISVHGVTISEETISSEMNLLEESINQELLEKGTPIGLKSKKIVFCNGDSYVVLLITSVWHGGNNHGDAIITSKCTDITDFITVK